MSDRSANFGNPVIGVWVALGNGLRVYPNEMKAFYDRGTAKWNWELNSFTWDGMEFFYHEEE